METDFSGPEFEETLNMFREVLPRTWWNLYQGSLQQGFNDRQAMVLLQTYILGQNPNGSNPPESSGPDSDIPEE